MRTMIRLFVFGTLATAVAARPAVSAQANEWQNGHLPNATLVFWQDLFADQRSLKFKSQDDLRAFFTRAGVKPDQQVVTYCAVGMRASLMYWAAKRAGLPARVYVGSWQDWSHDSTNPIVK